jgi:hypothetical protein
VAAPNSDTIDKEVQAVTQSMTELVNDPKNVDKMKSVEIALLTATTLATDTFWKKLLCGSLLMLDMVIDESLVSKMWTVITTQLFEGNNLSTVSEMFKSLKTSTTTRSVKQFLATFLTPLIGNKSITVGEIEILALNAGEKVEGTDLVSCVVETVNYMVDASRYFMEHGSLLGFLVPVPELRGFMEEYWSVVDKYDKIKNGQLETEFPEIHQELTELALKASDLRKITTDPHGSRQITQCAGHLAAKVRECVGLMTEGGFKRMPFSLYVYGPTRCGKTTITNILEKQLSEELQEPITPGSKATISGAAKFMTELHPTTKWVVIDDVASVRPEFVTDPPAETFLRLVNNVVTSLNQASVERKGEASPRPHAVICTSNVYDMGSVATQNDPRPILARIHLHVEMNVKKEWLTPQGLWDAKRFYDDYQKGILGDSWNFTMRQMVPEDSPVYCKRTLRDPPLNIGGVNYAMVTIEDEEFGKLEDVGIDVFLKVVRREVANNLRVQKIAEKLNKETVFTDHFCKTCKNRYEACDCASKANAECVVSNLPIVSDGSKKMEPPETLVRGFNRNARDVPEVRARSNGQRIAVDPVAVSEQLEVETSVVVEPAQEIVVNRLGVLASELHDRIVRNQTDKVVRGLKPVGFHFGNIVGFNVDPVVCTNKLIILADTLLRVIAKTRVFHYATWIPGDISDDVLQQAVMLTHEREINEQVYSSVVSKFIRRLGISSCALVAPACGLTGLLLDPGRDSIEHWVRSKYDEWLRNRQPEINTEEMMEPADLRTMVEERYNFTHADKVCNMNCAFATTGAALLTAVKLSSAICSFVLFIIGHLVSVLNPVGIFVASSALSYAIIMLTKDLTVEREVAVKTIMLQIRGARQTYRVFREGNPVFATAAALGLTSAVAWRRWTRTVMCEPAASVTRDPFYYEKWVSAHMSPLVHQTGGELENTVKNNVVVLTYEDGNNLMRTRATAIGTSRLIVCQHFLPKERTKMKLIRSPITFSPGGLVTNSVINLDYEPMVNETPIGETELVLLRLKERVQFSDIKDRFSTSVVCQSSVGRMINRTSDGESKVGCVGKIHNVNIQPKVKHRMSGKQFPSTSGLQFEGENAYGDCGSSILVGDKKSVVQGIFMGKLGNSPFGYAQCVTNKMVNDASGVLDKQHMPDLTTPTLAEHLLPDQKVDKKANFSHLDTPENHYDYLGKVSHFNPERDKIVKTPISEYLEDNGYPNNYTTPVPGANPDIKSYDSSMKYIKTTLEDTLSPPTEDLSWARSDYFDPIVDAAKSSGEVARPLDWFECANGVQNSLYVHAIDTSTAMGFPYGGKKNSRMHQDDDGKWWFDDDLKKDIVRCDKQCRSLVVPSQAATVTSKMEPRPKGKVARKIVSVNVVMTVLFKKYFGPVFEFILKCSELSESAVGVNPYSVDWEKMYNKIKPNIGDGSFSTDISGFDMRIGSDILNAVLLGCVSVAQQLGYTTDDVKAMHTLINWVLAAPTIIDGQLVVMYNRMISGVFGTSIIDGMVLSLLQRSCFHSIYPGRDSFRKHVVLRTFGDDGINMVKFASKRFNRKTLAKYCEKLGVIMTPADKEAGITCWDNANQLSFLKRGFRVSKQHGHVVGPLDQTSIMKPLHIGVATTAMTEEELLIENMTRSLVEMSFHGKNEWEKLRDILVAEPTGTFSKTVVCDWTYGDFVEAWKMRYCCVDPTKPLGNISNVFGMHAVEVEPASETRELDGYTDNVNDIQQTLKTSTPMMEDSRSSVSVQAFDTRGAESTDLGAFLERPIIIYERSVAVGSDVFDEVNFWREYMRSGPIRAKLRNFRYIRGTVVLQVYFNASPRYYGKFLAAVNWRVPGFGALGNYLPNYIDNILATQTLCTYFSVDVDKAQLEIPFVSKAEYIDMVATDDPGSGWVDGECGILYVRSMSSLRYAGDADVADLTDIQITMHLKDVELRGTTSSVIVFPASEKSPVHHIKNITDKLVVFGTAAMNVAENLGMIASIMGFSRENIGTEPGLMRPRVFGNTALCDVPTISAKLSVHRDQSMYIGYDPLSEHNVKDCESLCSIACHRSFITQFLWQEADAPATHLFSIKVKPCMAGSQDNALVMTSMAFAAYPFAFWSGSITFNFEVVASFLHRGRLLFVYDCATSGDYTLNENRCAILDITTDHSVGLTVTPNAINTFVPSDTPGPYHSILAYDDFDETSYGVLSVYVLNRLSAPESTNGSPVEILVYGNMENDARFAVPTPNITDILFVDPASECAPKQTSVLMNNSFEYGADTLGMYFGENILSVRALMQRFSYHCVVILSGISESEQRVSIDIPMRGVYRGPAGSDNPSIAETGTAPQTSGGQSYNFAYTTPLQYWASAYVGMRGSTRWKFFLQSYSEHGFHQGSWKLSNTQYASFRHLGFDTDADADDVAQILAHSHMAGAQAESVREPVEVELPYYDHNKFLFCRSTRFNGDLPMVQYDAFGISKEAGTVDAVHVWTAVGDDFSLLGYVGPPRVYIQSTMPARG